MTRVLVTGANGFVGSTLCAVLTQAGYQVRGAYRTKPATPANLAETLVVGDITSTTDWDGALVGVDAVIHTAARVHMMSDTTANAELYMETNARGTRRLAEAAARSHVQRFICLSSIKVNGEETTNRPYTRDDEPAPQDAYGASKRLAEQYLQQVAANTPMQATIVRPPLVYGPGVRANFLRLLRWVHKGVPLPLGSIENRRSLVSVWNLCDLLVHILSSPSVSPRTWLVSDGEDVSTPELVRRIGCAMGRPARLLPLPTKLLRTFGSLVGRSAEVRRLSGSLMLDIQKTRTELGWSPPVTLDEALARTVKWYLSEQRALAS